MEKILTKQYILDYLKEIKPSFKQEGIILLGLFGLFGSFSTGK